MYNKIINANIFHCLNKCFQSQASHVQVKRVLLLKTSPKTFKFCWFEKSSLFFAYCEMCNYFTGLTHFFHHSLCASLEMFKGLAVKTNMLLSQSQRKALLLELKYYIKQCMCSKQESQTIVYSCHCLCEGILCHCLETCVLNCEIQTVSKLYRFTKSNDLLN